MSSFILWSLPLGFKVLITNKEYPKQNSELMRFLSTGCVTRCRHSCCHNAGGLGLGDDQPHTQWHSLLQPWFALQRHHKGMVPSPSHSSPRQPKRGTKRVLGRKETDQREDAQSWIPSYTYPCVLYSDWPQITVLKTRCLFHLLDTQNRAVNIFCKQGYPPFHQTTIIADIH